MAELIVNVNPNSTYEDGDILCAFNDRNVQCTHAQQICHHQHAGFTNDGLRPEGKSLALIVFINIVLSALILRRSDVSKQTIWGMF